MKNRPLKNYIVENGKFKDGEGKYREGWRGRTKGDRRREKSILPSFLDFMLGIFRL